MTINFMTMRRRLIGGLLGLLLIPFVGGGRLVFELLRFLSRRPQFALALAGLGVVFGADPIVEQLPAEVRLFESLVFTWGALVVGILILGYGVSSREVRRVWRRVR